MDDDRRHALESQQEQLQRDLRAAADALRHAGPTEQRKAEREAKALAARLFDTKYELEHGYCRPTMTGNAEERDNQAIAWHHAEKLARRLGTADDIYDYYASLLQAQARGEFPTVQSMAAQLQFLNTRSDQSD
jgi:hypothetical protein